MKQYDTLNITHPDIAKEWHPTKNGALVPSDVSCGSGKVVWWRKIHTDLKSGKTFIFEWKMKIVDRINHKNSCPYLSGQKVCVGFNDLSTVVPKLAQQWHPTKNGNLKPQHVTAHSHKKVWWLFPYDDPNTGKHFDFEWQAQINNRIRSSECPFLNGHAVWPGFNDLATVHPNLASEFHQTKNGNLTPSEISARSGKKLWWIVRYYDSKTNQEFVFEWQDTVNNRVHSNGVCPFLLNKKVLVGFNDLSTTHPQLASEWHPTKNGKLKPTDVVSGSEKKVWWYKKYYDKNSAQYFDLEWQSSIVNRSKGAQCPYLTHPAKAVLKGFNDLTTTHPYLIQDLHPTKNGDFDPCKISAGSDKRVWWKIVVDGKTYEWKMRIRDRAIMNCGCPELSGSTLEIEVKRILQMESIDFQTEYQFVDCKTQNNGLYRFDFYLPKQNILIECDGIQHFSPVKLFGGQDVFEKQTQSDFVKNNFAKQNNILILRIPYIYNKANHRQSIKQFIQHTIATRTVPQEIIDFYSQFEFSNYIQCVKKYESQHKTES